MRIVVIRCNNHLETTRGIGSQYTHRPWLREAVLQGESLVVWSEDRCDVVSRSLIGDNREVPNETGNDRLSGLLIISQVFRLNVQHLSEGVAAELRSRPPCASLDTALRSLPLRRRRGQGTWLRPVDSPCGHRRAQPGQGMAGPRAADYRLDDRDELVESERLQEALRWAPCAPRPPRCRRR